MSVLRVDHGLLLETSQVLVVVICCCLLLLLMLLFVCCFFGKKHYQYIHVIRIMFMKYSVVCSFFSPMLVLWC